MKKEELLSIGLTEEQAEKIFALNGKDIEKHNIKSYGSDIRGELSKKVIRRLLTDERENNG